MLLQSEIANRRAQQNTFVRQLGDISRTLRSMGLYHLVQVTVLALDCTDVSSRQRHCVVLGPLSRTHSPKPGVVSDTTAGVTKTI